MEFEILFAILFAAIILAIYVVTWAKWFIGLYKAKNEFDECAKKTKAIMQHAFEETRKLQSAIDDRRR